MQINVHLQHSVIKTILKNGFFVFLSFSFKSEMMDQFVMDLTELWTEVGLELKPRMPVTDDLNAASESGKLGFCPQGGITCEYCQEPVLFEKLEAREKSKDSRDFLNIEKILPGGSRCLKPNCPQMVTAAA